MMLRSFTTARLINFVLVYFSFHFSRLLKRSFHAGSPVAVSIEPTTSCNLRCPECPSGLRSFSRQTGMLETSLFRKVIEEVSGRSFYLTLYFQGEPFLNPDVYEMISYARKKKMIVVTSTNGHYLTEENCRKIIDSGLNKLIISIDGATQASYQKYRIGGKLSSVIEGVRMLARMKKATGSDHPLISVQTVVFSTNEHELDSIRRLADEIGADEVKFKSAQVYEFMEGNTLLPDNERLSRYTRTKDGKYEIRNVTENKCWKMWSSTVITWDGKVVPCCFDKDAMHRIGDLSRSTLASVWRSSAYNSFRNAILKDRSSIDICRNCSEGSKVFVE